MTTDGPSRRAFLRQAVLVGAGFSALRGHVEASNPSARVDLYGPLVPDPDGILDLPEGFSYRMVARSGERMTDGLLRPGKPDGMAAFASGPHQVVLVCNHEISNHASALGPFGDNLELLGRVDPSLVYDFRPGDDLHMGGTTTLVYDLRRREVVREFLSLAGTDRNCAGGPTPWGTWITCEEPEITTGDEGALRHGFAFEVPTSGEPELVRPVPLAAMGRFRREAVAVDPASGAIYQTEDREDGLVYRFLPDEPGCPEAGGRLQALALAGRDSADTRNWDEARIRVGRRLPVRWIDVGDPLAPNDDLRHVHFDMGAARFARGEGMWFGNGSVFFCCTNGGPGKHGQIFRYRPSRFEGTARESEAPGSLELFLESDEPTLLDMCDNVTVAPWGDLVVCEDTEGRDHLRGVAMDGAVYNLGRNALNDAEFCGVCFAPNHPTLFVNIQDPGLTLAVTGPWERREARRFG